MQLVSVNLPVKSYIKKFLVFRYGDQFNYSHASALSPIIRSVLSKDTTKNLLSFNTRHYYTVNLSDWYVTNYGVFIDSDNLYDFNNGVDHVFREELFQMMIFNKDFHNIKYRKTLTDVLKSMVITESDLKFETIMRDFKRKKSKIDAQKNKNFS